jgi:predicted enzyme related to lactoylglutathione lyase
MGRRTSYEPGTFSWVELATTDPDGAKTFYSSLFGWETQDNPLPDGGIYIQGIVAGEAVAGVALMQDQQREAGVPPFWFNYVTVAGADESAARAKELGGGVHAPPFDVMDLGRMAVIADPTGAMFGIWEAKATIGAGRVNDPGCLTWNELATTDTDAARAFYSGLFGWGFEAMPTGAGPPYWVIQHEGAAAGRNGGLRPLAPEQTEAGVPSHWMPYFAVESTDATVERATDAGGRLMFGPMDVPAGRFAALADPQGAIFGVTSGEFDD